MIAREAEVEFWLNERSRENRDRLFARYHYLCPRAARKFCRRGADRADLEQMAAIGLLKACDRYDGRLKTPFEAFAWLFVVGELMHYVKSDQTIVLGGLLRDVDSQTVSKIPFLADIPVFGKIFQNRQDQHTRDEVVFLITPHVIFPNTPLPTK